MLNSENLHRNHENSDFAAQNINFFDEKSFFFSRFFFVMRKMSIFAENTIDRIHEHHLRLLTQKKNFKNLHYLLFFLRAPHNYIAATADLQRNGCWWTSCTPNQVSYPQTFHIPRKIFTSTSQPSRIFIPNSSFNSYPLLLFGSFFYRALRNSVGSQEVRILFARHMRHSVFLPRR